MILKFAPVKKCGRKSALNAKRPKTRSKPRNGLAVFRTLANLAELPGDRIPVLSLPDGSGDNSVLGPFGGRADRRQDTAAHDPDRIAHTQQLRKIRTDKDDGFALRGQFPHQLVDLHLAADIDASRR